MSVVTEHRTADEAVVEANIEGGDIVTVDWDTLGIDPESDGFHRPVVLCNSPV